MSKLRVGDVWYGKTGTLYENVVATITKVNPRRVQVSFDRMIQVSGKKISGNAFGQQNFMRLFDKKNQQMVLPFMDQLD